MQETIGGGRYRLIECLGRGRRSEVWRGLDTRADAFRAIKRLYGEGLAARRDVITVAGHRLERLRHPHIVTVRDVGLEGDTAFLVMDLVPGGTLEARLRRDGPLPPRMAVGVLRGVLAALAFAFEQGVVHQRLTPRKVLLEADGTPRVTDFGVAEIEGPDSPGTQPPDDVAAAGALLYAMVRRSSSPCPRSAACRTRWWR
jgi:serine/threonine-protein kinase